MSNGSGFGHAAVVNSINGSAITIASQNTKAVYDSTAFTINGGTISMTWTGYSVVGDIHAPVSNSGFNSGSNFNHWNMYPGTNYANYTASSGVTPFEGDQYLATNAYQTGGSIYQDIPYTTSAGQDYCFSVMLTTADSSGSGGSGSI